MLKLFFFLFFLNREWRDTISKRAVQMSHEIFIALQGASPTLHSHVAEPESTAAKDLTKGHRIIIDCEIQFIA